jgi:hypothetical protein
MIGEVRGVEHGRRVADAIYGTILVLAVIAALSEDESASAATILGGAAATSVVFWIVHVYAQVLDRETAGDTSPFWQLVRESGWQEWPLVQAALLPMVPLLLSALGVFSRSTAVTLALAIGITNLATWGYVAGRAVQHSRLRSALTGAGAVALGLVMVLLKNLVH